MHSSNKPLSPPVHIDRGPLPGQILASSKLFPVSSSSFVLIFCHCRSSSSSLFLSSSSFVVVVCIVLVICIVLVVRRCCLYRPCCLSLSSSFLSSSSFVTVVCPRCCCSYRPRCLSSSFVVVPIVLVVRHCHSSFDVRPRCRCSYCHRCLSLLLFVSSSSFVVVVRPLLLAPISLWRVFPPRRPALFPHVSLGQSAPWRLIQQMSSSSSSSIIVVVVRQ